jgi:ketosteroid isomerase-like protein
LNTEFSVADRLFKGIESKDTKSLETLYSDDVRIWHNFSNAEQTKQENLVALRKMCMAVPHIEYEILERHMVDGRVLQRHNLKCETETGEKFVIPACMFITIRGNQISRIEEYLDSGQANALRLASGREPINT